jgi:ribosome recycling factor
MLDPAFQSALDDARAQMRKSLEHLAEEFDSVRVGRANPKMVENVHVDAYGSQMPMNQVASVSAPQADLLVIQPWDKGMLQPIEKAIQAANLGLNPSNDGQLIRLAIPPMTEERRKEIAKTARARGEEARISVRNVRRSSKDDIKKAQQADNLPEDMRFEAENQLQKLTDEFTAKIDAMLDRKEKEIMEV